MRRTVAIAVVLVALTFAGFALADVVITGDSGGTVTPGQLLTISVSDFFTGSPPGQQPYGSCNQNAKNVASGQFTIGPLGPAEGGVPWTPLSISCETTGYYTGNWTYSGSYVVTVPPDAPATMRVSVAVQESVPSQYASMNGSDSTWKNSYSYNQTYAVTTTAASTTAPLTTTGATTTTTGGGRTTTPSTTTTAATTPATTTTSVGNSPAPPKPSPTGSGRLNPAVIGKTVPLARRTQVKNCKRGVLPDRQCSPGAYYSGLTKGVICLPSFRAGSIPEVPASEQHAVEVEYGMKPGSYGRAIEIDRIVSVELGGSKSIANLYPEPGSGTANYHVKDRLEKKLHAMVCGGEITLSAARHGIASNWERLYTHVFGTSPAGTAPSQRKPKVPALYKNCANLNKKYPHGVGEAGARDHTSGTPVTTFTRSTKLYKLAIAYNPRLDGDKDGIACEKH
jgi:Excalibur calcium-binding domain